MRIIGVLRGWIGIACLLAACAAFAPAAARAGAGGTVVLVAPDVEVHRAGHPLPSARASEAAARAWPDAAAAALGLGTPPRVWTPPSDPRDDPALTQALALQEAIAATLRPAPREPRPRQPRLSLGRDGARALRAATGADFALFTRLRIGGAAGEAVATLVDLDSGDVVARRALGPVRDDPSTSGGAARLARRLLRGFPAYAAMPDTATAPRPLPEESIDADLDRAVARSGRALLAHPARDDDPQVHAFLRALACRLAPDRCERLRLHLLREPGFNAWALPDDVIVLRTGALLRCRDSAEVAFVLAHELAHARRGDARARWRRGDFAGDHAGTREAESAADADALAMLATAGFPASAAERLLRRVSDEPAPVPRAAVSTHPPLDERVAGLRARLAPTGGGGDGDVGPVRDDAGADPWLALLATRFRDWLGVELVAGRPDASAVLLEGWATAAATGTAEDGDAGAAIRRDADMARRALAGEPHAAAAVAQWLTLPDGGATPPSSPAGEPGPRIQKAPGLEVPTADPWARQRARGIEQWTRHGLALDRLVIVTGVAPGDPVLPGVPGAPAWRPGTGIAGLRLDLAAALHRAGWLEVATSAPEPWRGGGERAWQAEIAAAAASGLRYRGRVMATQRRGRLVLMVWLAPALHYHPQEAAATRRMLDGTRPVD